MKNPNIAAIVFITTLHLGALAAPWTFTWSAFFVFLFLWWFTGCLGITLGFHRLLTHGSFTTYKWVERTLSVLGCLACQGPPIQWVSDHRQHHQFADKPGDPHSPVMGFWWSHMLWGFELQASGEAKERAEHYTPDLLADPFMFALSKLFLPILLASAILLYVLGGWPWLVWGFFVRLVVALHITWAINSVCHWTGYRNYKTHDESRNVWWLAVPSFGESWHNNHHADPTTANHGHHPWEPDHTYWLIQLMAKYGLAWDVKTHKSEMV